MKTVEFLDYLVIDVEVEEEDIFRIESGMISCLNTHAFVVAEEDVVFKTALRNSTLLLCDGIGISIASWCLSGKWIRRYDGPYFHQDLLNYLKRTHRSRSILYFGSSEEVSQLLQKKVSSFLPLCKVYAYSPVFVKEFSEIEIEQHKNLILGINPDIIFVGLTAPKQEKWSFEMYKSFDDKLFVNIGAEFDFYAGKIRRHPGWVADAGMLWLYRLILEPKRIWRRVFISGIKFIIVLCKK